MKGDHLRLCTQPAPASVLPLPKLVQGDKPVQPVTIPKQRSMCCQWGGCTAVQGIVGLPTVCERSLHAVTAEGDARARHLAQAWCACTRCPALWRAAIISLAYTL